MQQQSLLELEPPRARGKRLADKCADKAQRVSTFDTTAAGRFILGWMARFGQQSGEALVEAAREHGHRPHDDRAFGAVFQMLVRANSIECVGFCERRKGNGTAGGRIWRLKL